MTIKTFFAVALLAGSGLVQAAPNLVTNGSFESGAGGLGRRATSFRGHLKSLKYQLYHRILNITC